ncbi:hypothetical protein VSY18_10495 [Bacillus albus]|uniref:hypothetical protein n=1 Tax=Bacillus cereus group TaxID=86661 RepID=UPI0022E6A293|nr:MULTISPECIES: hypothetical protein [Bacillus cereus group]MDA2028692.1 hypothetical protein [Bacillus cereus group sp. Bcc03]MDA2262772.1 hypothetical protein [Bacillus cereus group sp. Bc200]MDA2322502.1 hypothetical protein [Bacillus cereus group sp. Bc177]MDA2711866.1 hypothetical protein [Bacillus cereus group sp. Bc025]HDR7718189.1 hypothetical protein [Bacillus albus]
MWNIKEEDLEKFRMTCKDRLSPEGAMVFFIGGIVYTSVFMFFIFMGGLEYYNTFFDKTIVKIEIVLYSLQFIFLILYSFPKARYKFQKLQTLVVLLYAFQLGTITFTALVLPGISDYSIDRMTLICVGLLFVGAVIVHIVTTIDTFKQASEGAFSMDERSISFFSKRKGDVMKWATIYALILFILIYFHNGYGIDVLVLYAVGIVLLYTVAIGAAEFQLLVYCRFKFKSFNMTWEENERKCGRIRKQNKKFKTKNK